MLRLLLLTMVLVATGCASRRQQQLTLAHQVSVPTEWSSGKGIPGPPGDSDIERYIDAYRHYCWPVRSVQDLRLAPFHIGSNQAQLAFQAPKHIAEQPKRIFRRGQSGGQQ